MARPCIELDQEKHRRICEAMRVGASFKHVALYAETSKQTLYRWIQRGKAEKSGPYWELWRDSEKAKADLVIALLLKINQAANRDWKAAAWKLERLCPDLYGKTRASQSEKAAEMEGLLDD